jgi:hypothetical protein
MDTIAFYQTMSALCFTLVGFWWVVVQFRHDEMTRDVESRRFITLVMLQFLIPGLVNVASILSAESLWWRLAFAAAGLLGMAAVLVGMRGALSDLRWYVWLSLPIYAAITLVALFDGLVESIIPVDALQVEGVLLLALVSLGVMLAWGLFTRPRQDARS